MLARSTLDLIDCCLPPSWHPENDHRRAGSRKARLLREADRAAASRRDAHGRCGKRAGKLLLIGHVLPVLSRVQVRLRGRRRRPLWAAAGRAFPADHLGSRLAARLLQPGESRRGRCSTCTVHDAHFHPLAVRNAEGRADGRHDARRSGETGSRRSSSQIRRRMVTATSGVIDQQGRPFTHATRYLEKATLFFVTWPCRGRRRGRAGDGAARKTTRCCAEAERRAGPTDAFFGELSEVVRESAPKTPSPLLAGELARDPWCSARSRRSRSVKGRAVKV